LFTAHAVIIFELFRAFAGLQFLWRRYIPHCVFLRSFAIWIRTALATASSRTRSRCSSNVMFPHILCGHKFAILWRFWIRVITETDSRMLFSSFDSKKPAATWRAGDHARISFPNTSTGWSYGKNSQGLIERIVGFGRTSRADNSFLFDRLSAKTTGGHRIARICFNVSLSIQLSKNQFPYGVVSDSILLFSISLFWVIVYPLFRISRPLGGANTARANSFPYNTIYALMMYILYYFTIITKYDKI
jgi:hypothetical protein